MFSSGVTYSERLHFWKWWKSARKRNVNICIYPLKFSKSVTKLEILVEVSLTSWVQHTKHQGLYTFTQKSFVPFNEMKHNNHRPAFAPLYTNQYSHHSSMQQSSGGILSSSISSSHHYATSQYLNSSSIGGTLNFSATKYCIDCN